MRWLIRADEPFPGHVLSVVDESGVVRWTDGWTVEQYSAERGFPVRTIDDAELDRLVTDHVDGLRTEPERITAERYDEALNCLPPCRWCRHLGIEMFHVSERITHDLVDWFGKLGGVHVRFVDRAGLSRDEVAAKVARAAR